MLTQALTAGLTQPATVPVARGPRDTVGGFSPRQLPGLLAWFDPSDLATLFQDAAGTTPVTAAGQPVGLIRDKSGNGLHASQSDTTKRLVYQPGYLANDAAADTVHKFLRTGTRATVAQPYTVIAGVHFDSVGVSQFVLDGVTATDRLVLYNNLTNLQLYAGAAVTVEATPVAQNLVVTGVYNGASTSSRRDGVAKGTGDVGAQGWTGLTLGAQYTDNTSLGGRIYGVIVCAGVLTAAQITAAEKWLGRRAGLAL